MLESGQGAPAKLASEQRKPDGKADPQGAGGENRRHVRPDQRAGDTARDELINEGGAVVAGGKVEASPDQRAHKAEHHIGADYLSGGEGGEVQQRQGAEGAGAGGREADLGPDTGPDQGQPAGMLFPFALEAHPQSPDEAVQG